MIKEDKTTGRISELELMRFIAALAIVAYHFGFVVDRGYIFVEFFFILTGLFMAQSAQRSLNNAQDLDIGKDTKRFMIRKLKPLLPFLILSYILMIIAYMLKDDNILNVDMICNQIPNYLLLMDGGFTISSPIMPDVTWYVSAMIIGLLILYPLYLHCRNSAWIMMILIFIFTIGYIINNSINLDQYRQWGGWICLGLLRGIGEIALGAFCFELCKHIGKINLTTIGRILYTLIVLILIAALLFWSIGELGETKDFVMIFVIATLIVLMYCEKSYHIPRGNKICQYLGALSLPMYLFHRPIQKTIQNLFGGEWFNDNVTVDILSVIVFSMIVIGIINYLKKSNKDKITGMFIKRQ